MILTSLGQLLFVRFARKALWLPTARSKLFRINDHTFYSPEEVKKIRSLYDNYRKQVYSMNEFMKHEFYIPATQSGGLPKEFIEKEEEQDKIAFAENDKENARIAKIREEAFSKQIKELEIKVLQEKNIREEELLLKAEEADELIMKLKSDPNSFVTPDNIEAIIEGALENPINYEYAIDTSGRKIKSRSQSREARKR